MRHLFLIFLLLFLLAGLAPAFQKLFSKIVEYFGSLDTSDGPFRTEVKSDLKEIPARRHDSPTLYEFEAIVMARLSQTGGKGLSLKSLADDLHLDPLFTKKTLVSLGGKGFVRSTRSVVGGRRFSLSAKGREYAIGEGFLPRPRRRLRGAGR
jgi:hypothetical protein